ncbi:MAG: hypothetical protein WCG37_02450 [Actinomycetes bacterium]
MTSLSNPLAARSRHIATIFLISLAGLLLEVAFTRIVSFKLWYYYTYLVLGLALLGIGSGGIFVVVWPRLRKAATDTVVTVCALAGAVLIAASEFVISWIPINTIKIWDYGTADSWRNLGVLIAICFTLFVAFIMIGVIVAVLLGRAEDRVNRFYFADLIGAALGCALAIPLIWWLGPPQVVMLAALVMALAAVVANPRLGVSTAIAGVLGVLLLLMVVQVIKVPDVQVEGGKEQPAKDAIGGWGPVFRVDAEKIFDNYLLLHDGTFGSGIHAYKGDPAAATEYDTDPRVLPFSVHGEPPAHTLIIGSAGGNEIVAALHFKSPKIEGVELNPITVGLLKGRLREFSGDLPNQPGVAIHQGDGRSFIFRSKDKYNLVWYVAPDSYAASNAASSGAFVLSESYLYTSEMISESLKHLTNDGIMVVQFGELDYVGHPSRTARYVMTARNALSEIGVADPSQHIIVSSFVTNKTGDLSTIMVKRTPFTPEEVGRLNAAVPTVPLAGVAYAPGGYTDGGIVGKLAGAPTREAANKIAATYPREIFAVHDDRPFFWHFSGFGSVLSNITKPFSTNNPEDVIGERVLLLLLLVAIGYATLFLLAPFIFVRKEWRALPAKGRSALYFAALGLGFMLYEISMIQRLVRFLGYPTYSLTVTLASILFFTGLGALLSKRFSASPRRAVITSGAALAVLGVFYLFALDPITDALLPAAFGIRVCVTVVLLAPLGLCLGMFMPLGLGVVSGLGPHPDEYVAWGWAVNGFFSVIGSVTTTILAMAYGFQVVQITALCMYGVAVLAFLALDRKRETLTAAQ